MANGAERPRERGSPFGIDHSPFTYSPEMQKAPPDGPDEASLFLSGHCFLIAAHLHHLRVEQSGAKTFLQIPALDGGSTWWRHRTGQDAPPRMVTLLIGDRGWGDLAVL